MAEPLDPFTADNVLEEAAIRATLALERIAHRLELIEVDTTNGADALRDILRLLDDS